ncbi:MAG: HAMP domain-containing histidine kinase [Bacilli bacterium]|nr:HAMP domain-containing histidine kinase [Bacilli bacterium]
MSKVLSFSLNAGFSLCSIFICLCILFAYFLKNREKRLEEKSIYFILDLCSITIMSIVEIIYVLYFINVGVDGKYANALYHLYSLTILSTTFFSWVFVISYRLSLNEDATKKGNSKYVFYTIIGIIQLIIGIMIFVMPVNIYAHYGIFTFDSFPITAILVYVLVSTTSFVFMLYYKNKNITNRDLYPSIVSLVLICLLLVYRLIKHVDINIETFEFTIFTLGVFFTVENQDYKLISLAKQKQAAAEKATSSQQDFLSSIAHGIRSPMNTILGLSQLLLQDDNLTKESVKDDMTSIHDASTSLLSLINNITDYSYLISDKGEVLEKEYDIQDVLFELNSAALTKITNSNVDFNLSVTDGVPKKLLGDSEKVTRTLLNILSNAISYTETGDISLEVKGEKKGKNIIQLEFLIKTTGVSKNKDVIDIDSPKFMELGTGGSIDGNIDNSILCIQIAKDLTDVLNGHLEVVSEEGSGTTYTLTINQKESDSEGENVDHSDERKTSVETVNIENEDKTDFAKMIEERNQREESIIEEKKEETVEKTEEKEETKEENTSEEALVEEKKEETTEKPEDKEEVKEEKPSEEAPVEEKKEESTEKAEDKEEVKEENTSEETPVEEKKEETTEKAEEKEEVKEEKPSEETPVEEKKEETTEKAEEKEEEKEEVKEEIEKVSEVPLVDVKKDDDSKNMEETKSEESTEEKKEEVSEEEETKSEESAEEKKEETTEKTEEKEEEKEEQASSEEGGASNV